MTSAFTKRFQVLIDRISVPQLISRMTQMRMRPILKQKKRMRATMAVGIPKRRMAGQFCKIQVGYRQKAACYRQFSVTAFFV